MARLFVLSGNSIGETYDIDATSTLGRGDDVDVKIPDASISRQHARLVPHTEAGVWKLIDLKSSNGVFLDGRRVAKGLVRNGQTFRLGEVEIRLKDDPAAGAAEGALEQESGDLDWSDGGAGELEAPDQGPAGEPDEIELEFDGDLDEALRAETAPTVPPAPPLHAPRQRPSPEPAGDDNVRAGAVASQERAARRRRAMGEASQRPSTVTDGGRPVLQYAKVRSSGTDLAQLPGWQKLIVAVLAVGLLGAAAYGAFALTMAAKGAPATHEP